MFNNWTKIEILAALSVGKHVNTCKVWDVKKQLIFGTFGPAAFAAKLKISNLEVVGSTPVELFFFFSSNALRHYRMTTLDRQ